MDVATKYLEFSTPPNYHMVEITEQVRRLLKESSVVNGVVTLFCPGATGSITTIEYEPGLVRDMEEMLKDIIPQQKKYWHNERWGDGNGHSHIRASLLGPSLSVPVVEGAMTLGTWQQIVFIDFDVPARQRKLVVQIMGK